MPVHMIAKEFSFKRSQELLKYVSKDFLGDGCEIALESKNGGYLQIIQNLLYRNHGHIAYFLDNPSLYIIIYCIYIYIYYYINSTQVHQGPVACKGTCGPDRSCKMLLPRDTL